MNRFLRLGSVSCLLAARAMAGPIAPAELNYDPSTDADEEFIELVNTSNAAFNLAGCQFTTGITYTFTSGTVAPGARLVVCRDRTKFIARYGNLPNLAAGTYSGRLADDGETVVFVGADATELFRVQYRPDGDWPSRAAGLGSSLEVIDPDGNLNDPANWRSSAEYLGSPGRAGVGPQRQILINELLAHTDPPLEDAVELVNTTDQPINVGGWYLSDSRSNPTRYRIPSPFIVPARGYAVVYEYQFNSPRPAPGDNPFTYNSSQGEEAVLLSADANGTPLLWMDAISFEATANGVSLGRFPDASGRLVPMSDLTFGTSVRAGDNPLRLAEFRTGAGASNAYPLIGPVVFNRIQYRPAAGGDEFLELVNSTGSNIPLYDPLNPGNRWKIAGGVDFTFTELVVLAPGETVLVVPTDPAAFRAKYGLAAGVKIAGPYTNSLSNSGERIALYKPDPPQLPPHPDAGLVPYILVEEVRYSNAAPWPTGADGTGIALRRRTPFRFGDDPAEWRLDVPVTTIAPNLSFTWDGTQLTLRWNAVNDSDLILEQSGTPVGGTWTNPVTLAPGTSSRTVAVGANAVFFRLRLPAR